MAENRCAVRKGRALLAGLVRCGQCGRKLRVIYNRKSSAMYFCDGAGPRGARTCLCFGAKYVDREVGAELCRAMEPLAIEAAMRAFELEREERERAVEHARLRVEAAQYAADRAFEQYDLADPKNRLVVDNLEKRLNEKLVEVRIAQEELERRIDREPPLTREQREELLDLSRDFPRLWNHPDTPTTLRKQLLRAAIREVIAKREGSKLAFTIHWVGDTCTHVAINKRATPVGSRTDASLTNLVRKLAASSLDDAEIARILNMKKIPTPRDLRWTQDRVKSFRSRARIRTGPKPDPAEVLTGQQARDYLGIGYHGLTALVARGAIHTNQVTDFAPWRISRTEIDSDYVRSLVALLKQTGKLPAEEGSPQRQGKLFTEN